MTNRIMRAALLGSATTLAMVATPALARDTGEASPATSADAAVFSASPAPQAPQARDPGDIIVTATRREERLQDVPVAVTAVSGQDLGKSAFREATDIQYLAPNITFSSTNPVANGGGYQIRGIGTQSFDSSVEQTVGVVIDGVVVGLVRDPGLTGFSDVERVEVLRGPQGTLFGKNSSAGVIQVITKKPQLGTRSLDLDLSLGERNDQLQRATVNLPLGGNAALRVSAFHAARDGAIPNIVNGTKVGDRDNYGLRGKLLWEPTDKLSLLLTGEYQTGFARDAQLIESLGNGSTPFGALYNATFAGLPFQPGRDVYASFQDGDWTARTKLWSTSFQTDYAISDFTLTSITAYRALKAAQLTDIDASPADIFNNSDVRLDSNQFTQELRLTSPGGKPLEYTLGLYYYHTTNRAVMAQYGNFYGLFGVPVVLSGGQSNQVNSARSLAAYGQATYKLVEGVKLIGGLRYTNDRNRGELVMSPLPFPAVPISPVPNYSGIVSADNVSGKVGLQFEPNRDLMLYATYSTGYKGPAIDGRTGVVLEVKPETVSSYEVGLKSTLFNGMLTLNGSLYWSDFSNFQAQTADITTTPVSFYLSNAGRMRARGVELEASLRVSSRLRLSANGSYSEATFRRYVSSCYAGQPLSPVVGQGCYADPTTQGLVANYAGYRLPNAPEWSYMVRADFNQPLTDDLKLDANANWAWRGKTLAALGDPRTAIGAYGLLNATIGIGGSDGAWRVGVYTRNLLDKRFHAPFSAGTINPGGYFKIVSPDAFRTIGGTLSFHF